MIRVTLNGENVAEIARPEELNIVAEIAGVDVADFSINADDLLQYKQTLQREKIRKEIEPVAGDTPSIQGTIADNVGLLLEELGRFMLAAQNSNDPVIASAAQPLAVALSPLVAAVDAGDCILTHHVKTTSVVVQDACERSHAVAGVFIANVSEGQS